MSIDTYLLGLIAVSLFWGQVLRDPWNAYWSRPAKPAFADVPPAPAPLSAPDRSMSFLLCNDKGQVEHEISFQGDDAPEQYVYAGKTYVQERKRHPKHADDHDVIWEYRR